MSAAHPTRVSRTEWISGGALLALLLWIRAGTLGRGSLWLDEIWSLAFASGRGAAHLQTPVGKVIEHGESFTAMGIAPIWAIWTHLTTDVHPPLFYLVLRAWAGVFGTSDVALRMLPIVLSVAMAGVAFMLVRRTVGILPAHLTLLLLAVSPLQNFYAAEVRSYALLSLLTVAAMATAQRYVEVPSRWRLAAFCAALYGMMLTHYFAVGAGLGLCVYVAAAAVKGRRLALLAALAATATIYALTWGPQLLAQRATLTTVDHLQAVGAPWTYALARAINFPLMATSLGFEAPTWLRLVVGVGFAAAVVWAAHKQRRLWLYAAPVAGGLAVLVAFDMAGHNALSLSRYVIHLTLPVFVLIAAIVPRGPVWLRVLPTVAAVAGILQFARITPAPTLTQWAEVAALLDRRASPADIVVYHTPLPPDWRPAMNYLCLSHYSRVARENRLALLTSTQVDPPPLPLSPTAAIWLLTTSPPEAPPAWASHFRIDGFTPIPGQATADSPRTLFKLVPSENK